MTWCPHTSCIHPNLSCVLDTTSLYQRITLASLPMIPSSRKLCYARYSCYYLEFGSGLHSAVSRDHFWQGLGEIGCRGSNLIGYVPGKCPPTMLSPLFKGRLCPRVDLSLH